MLKRAHLLFLLALPLALSTVPQDGALKEEAREIITEAGYLYELSQSEADALLTHAHEHSITFEKMPAFIRKRAIKSYFENLKREQSQMSRISYLPEILRGKRKVQTPDLELPLEEIYSDLQVRYGGDKVREFIIAITNTIIGNTFRLESYFKTNAVQVFFALNNPLNKHCQKLAESGTFENDTQLLYETAKAALASKPKLIKFILEVVVVGMFEVLRVTPCVLSSTDNYGYWLDTAMKKLKAPKDERTVFDPLPTIMARVERMKKNEDLVKLLSLSDVGDEENSLILISRYLERTNEVDRDDEMDLIKQFIQTNEFSSDTRLYHVKKALGPQDL
jgi:hypothetical protein